MASNSKLAGRRAKPSEIMHPGVVVTCIYMGHISVQGHSGVIQCTCVNIASNSKTDGRTEKRS